MKTTFAAIAIATVALADDYHADEYSGPIAPESYGYAVNAWNIEEPTIDDECYAHQVDIYSDQIVAIEATRYMLTKLIKRVEWAEEEIEDNASEIGDNDRETRANAAEIREIELDLSDLEECLHNQEDMQYINRAVIELYCHSQAYVAWIMDECKPVLVDGTRLPYGIDFSLNENATPAAKNA